MKKYCLSFLLLFATSTFANDVVEEENSFSSKKANETAVSDVSPSEKSQALSLESSSSPESHKLSLSNYDFFGINYTADFNNAGEGVIGFEGHALGLWLNTIGLSMGFGYGLPFDNGSGQLRLGPNFGLPLSKNVCIYAPLEGLVNFVLTGSGKDEKWKTAWGVQARPSIGLKFGKFAISAGIAVGWVEKADKVSTGFTASIGYDF